MTGVGLFLNQSDIFVIPSNGNCSSGNTTLTVRHFDMIWAKQNLDYGGCDSCCAREQIYYGHDHSFVSYH